MQEQHKLPTQADKNYGEVIMYQTDDGQTQLDVRLENDTIWLTANQMALLFGRDEKTIRKHINNAITEELYDSVVVAKFATTTKHGAMEGKTQSHDVSFYNLDVIISVGYRVKSKHGVDFRRWANSVLKEYLLRGYAVKNVPRALFVNGRKTIDDYTLVALTIMIAESRSEEKEMMISVIMNCLG